MHWRFFSLHLWQRGRSRLHFRFAWTHLEHERRFGYGMVGAALIETGRGHLDEMYDLLSFLIWREGQEQLRVMREWKLNKK